MKSRIVPNILTALTLFGLSRACSFTRAGTSADETPHTAGESGGDDRDLDSAMSPPSQIPSSGLPTSHAAQGPVIHSFTVEVQNLTPGKRVTCKWSSTGAVKGTLGCNNASRFMEWRPVTPNGTETLDILDSQYPNPPITLTVTDAQGREDSRTVKLDWPCAFPYFFAPELEVCPSDPPTIGPAAEQIFEHGRMIWLHEIGPKDNPVKNVIYVLYDDGRQRRYDDTWTRDDPESDPSILPPPGFRQPIRGFGKLWRTDQEIRSRLGWATTSEIGFTGAWQPQKVASLPSVAYIRTQANRIIRLLDWSNPGNWEWVNL